MIPTPGHSPGHVAFHLPDRGVLIAGDALCTYNPLTGTRGPQLMPQAFADDIAQALASLDALERIDAGTAALRPRRALDGRPGRGGRSRARRSHMSRLSCDPRREVAAAS